MHRIRYNPAVSLDGYIADMQTQLQHDPISRHTTVEAWHSRLCHLPNIIPGRIGRRDRRAQAGVQPQAYPMFHRKRLLRESR